MAGRPPKTEATALGKRIAEARKRKGLTQVQLAEVLDVSPGMVEYYERRADNVKAELVKKLCKALDMTADELLGLDAPRSKPGPKSKLRRQMEQIEELPRSRQTFVSQVIEELLNKKPG